jgi:hypothetical protein
MLYIISVNQPALTTGRQPQASRGKGNPMKYNARYVPGSTRSRRTALSRSFPFFLPSLLVTVRSENPSKTSPKSDHFRRSEFFNCSVPTPYNFNTLKRSDFPSALGLLASDNQRLAIKSHDARPKRAVDCYPFSPAEKVRMRDKLVMPFRIRPTHKKFTNTVQNETKRDKSHILQESTTHTNHLRRHRLQSSHFVETWRAELRDAFNRQRKSKMGCAKTVPFLCHFPRGRSAIEHFSGKKPEFSGIPISVTCGRPSLRFLVFFAATFPIHSP